MLWLPYGTYHYARTESYVQLRSARATVFPQLRTVLILTYAFKELLDIRRQVPHHVRSPHQPQFPVPAVVQAPSRAAAPRGQSVNPTTPPPNLLGRVSSNPCTCAGTWRQTEACSTARHHPSIDDTLSNSLGLPTLCSQVATTAHQHTILGHCGRAALRAPRFITDTCYCT
jgi:hypothetical protein